jgi:hypothetical protein
MNTDITTDVCSICYDTLDTEPQYTIPDCNHTFHTNCIVHWFRNGYRHCPLCNHLGLGSNKYCTSSNTIFSERIKDYVKKNNEPRWLMLLIDKYNKKQTELRQMSKEIKELKNKKGIYKEIVISIKKIQTKYNLLQWDSKKIEKKILSFPLHPIIVIIYKKPNKTKTKTKTSNTQI